MMIARIFAYTALIRIDFVAFDFYLHDYFLFRIEL